MKIVEELIEHLANRDLITEAEWEKLYRERWTSVPPPPHAVYLSGKGGMRSKHKTFREQMTAHLPIRTVTTTLVTKPSPIDDEIPF